MGQGGRIPSWPHVPTLSGEGGQFRTAPNSAVMDSHLLLGAEKNLGEMNEKLVLGVPASGSGSWENGKATASDPSRD